MLLIRSTFRFCTSFSRLNQVLYAKGEITDSDKSYIYDIFRHTHQMNQHVFMQERSLAMQMKILPKLDKDILGESRKQLETLIEGKGKYVKEIQTILKIFQLHNSNVLQLNQDTIDVLIFNAQIKVSGRIEHGFGNDGFILNSFTENIFLLERTNEETLKYLNQTYLDQINRISLFNLLKFIELINKYQVKGLENAETLVIKTLFSKIQFATLYDCGNVAKVYNKLFDSDTRSRLKDWIDQALMIVKEKADKSTTPNRRILMVNNMVRQCLTEFMDTTNQELITKLLSEGQETKE